MTKEPRFNGIATTQGHKAMSRIKGKDTRPEVVLRKALWAAGIRYRKNVKGLPGSPDVAITKYKLAVFVDSEFFHGKDWDTKLKRIKEGSNGGYWTAKIERNIERDIEKEASLRAIGYKVIRIWSQDVIKDTDACVRAVKEAIMDIEIGGDLDGE